MFGTTTTTTEMSCQPASPPMIPICGVAAAAYPSSTCPPATVQQWGGTEAAQQHIPKEPQSPAQAHDPPSQSPKHDEHHDKSQEAKRT